jgi:hypothetical protein
VIESLKNVIVIVRRCVGFVLNRPVDMNKACNRSPNPACPDEWWDHPEERRICVKSLSDLRIFETCLTLSINSYANKQLIELPWWSSASLRKFDYTAAFSPKPTARNSAPSVSSHSTCSNFQPLTINSEVTTHKQ